MYIVLGFKNMFESDETSEHIPIEYAHKIFNYCTPFGQNVTELNSK